MVNIDKIRMSAGIWVYKDKIIGYILHQGLYPNIYNYNDTLVTMLYYPRYHPSSRGFLEDISQYYSQNQDAWEMAQQIPDPIALTHACNLNPERVSWMRYEGDYDYYCLRDGTEIYTTVEEKTNDITQTKYYRTWRDSDTLRVLNYDGNLGVRPGEWVDMLIACLLIVLILVSLVLVVNQIVHW